MTGRCPRFVRVKIAVAKEARDGEARVAMVPELVAKLTGLGYDVAVEPGAGLHALIGDEEYAAAGAVLDDAAFEGADLVVSSGSADWPAARPRSPSCPSTRSRRPSSTCATPVSPPTPSS